MSQITATVIRETVAAFYGMTTVELAGSDRSWQACQRRAVAYHLCVELTDLTHAAIGAEFGGRDHSTVANGLLRPLSYEHEAALRATREQLIGTSAHAADVVRRWPFRTRRTPPVPIFIRRYTA
ncbi:helix-turn-helix domain-containing protein [uncultured Sulfitobacter sp.]|mgnify:CR=1 FL=1|uniref:helix-turn-helix domain-containing protein n=1 Tax=uncultured Sulfitobacter sp. TaxID=191468 RepID=UPI0030DB24A9|tara:strand:+ start:389 stop:760 length:372 start_codon:yes stop_codon:yes gene_type:complete